MKIDIKNLFYEIEGNLIYENLNLNIEGCGILALCGENGSGKTTLLNLINKSINPISGSVNILGDVIYARYNEALFLKKSVKENLKLCCDDLNKIKDELKIFDLDNLIDLKVCKLSKGEKMRLYLLMIILKSKDIILLDEVTCNLDYKHEEKILTYFKKISENRLIIIATNQKSILPYANDIISVNKKLDYKYIGETSNKEDTHIYNKKNVFKYLDLKLSFILLCLSMVFLFISTIFLGFSKTYNDKNVILNEIKACEDNYVLFSASDEAFVRTKTGSENEKIFVKNPNLNISYIYLSDLIKEDEIILSKSAYNRLIDKNIDGFDLIDNKMVCRFDNSYSFKIVGINMVGDVSVINKDIYNSYCYKYPIIRISIPYSIDIKLDRLLQTIPLNDCYINPSLDENTIIAPTGIDGIAKILIDNDEIEVNVISAGISNIIISNDIAIKLSKYYEIFYASDYAYGIKATTQNEEEIANAILNEKGYLYFNNTNSYSLVMEYGKENSSIFLIIYFIAFGFFVLIISLDYIFFNKQNKENINALRNFKFSNRKIIFSYSIIYFVFFIFIVGTLLFGYIYNRYIGLTYINIVIYLLKSGFIYFFNYLIIFCLLIGKYVLVVRKINNKQIS